MNTNIYTLETHDGREYAFLKPAMTASPWEKSYIFLGVICCHAPLTILKRNAPVVVGETESWKQVALRFDLNLTCGTDARN